MVSYIEFLNVPAKVAIIIIGIFFVLQIVGELLEFKGKVVPEFIKIRKYFTRKKREKQMVQEAFETLKEVKKSFGEFNAHYNSDNIKMRDEWIKGVNHKLEENDKFIQTFGQKLDKTNKDVVSLLIDGKRNTIINFASFVIDEKNPVTREQFNRVFKIYEEYEDIIISNDMTNGEVDIAYRIIKESYKSHMVNHTFIEDVRGYEN